MGRMSRILNFTCTLKQTWYKVFDEADYKENPVAEVKVKLRAGSIEDHFRYAYKPTTAPLTFAVWMTSASGFNTFKNLKKLYVYIPNNDAEVLEIEILYK